MCVGLRVGPVVFCPRSDDVAMFIIAQLPIGY